MTSPERDERPMSGAVRLLVIVASALVAIFAIGVIAGMIGAAMNDGGAPSAIFYPILLAAIALAAGAIWLIVRNRAVMDLPASPRMRKSRMLLYSCGVIGIAGGMAFALVGGGGEMGIWALFSANEPISPTATLILLSVLILATALSIRWHMLLDEHERAAYDFGAVVSIYIYFVLSIGWWLLARGGFAPAPDGHLIFWVVMITWLIGWLIRRYR